MSTSKTQITPTIQQPNTQMTSSPLPIASPLPPAATARQRGESDGRGIESEGSPSSTNLSRRGQTQADPPPASLLPSAEPWADPVDGRLLLDSLRQLLTRFVILPQSAAEALGLWILHTYAFQLRDIATY